MIVILNGHNEIKENIDKIKDKVIFDTKNIVEGEKVYKL